MSANGRREGRRDEGTNQRARRDSPRWRGESPRQLGENPNPRRAESARQWLARAEGRARLDEYLRDD